MVFACIKKGDEGFLSVVGFDGNASVICCCVGLSYTLFLSSLAIFVSDASLMG